MKGIVQKIADEIHAVEENGQPVQRSTVELVLMALRNRALEGDVRAIQLFLKTLEKFGQAESLETGGFLIIPEAPSEEEWEKQVAERQADLILRTKAFFEEWERTGEMPDFKSLVI